MKFKTICVSILSLLNLQLYPAYADWMPEMKINLDFTSPFTSGGVGSKIRSIIETIQEEQAPSTDFKESFSSKLKKGIDWSKLPSIIETANADAVEDAKEEASKTIETKAPEVTEYTDDDASIAVTVIIMLIMFITAPIFVAGCPKIDTGLHLVIAILDLVLEAVFWGAYEQGSTREMKIFEESTKDENAYDAQLDSIKTAMEITTKAQTWMNGKFGAQLAITIMLAICMAIVLIRSIIDTVKSVGAEAATAQSCKASAGYDPINLDIEKVFSDSRRNFYLPIPNNEIINRLNNAKDLGQLAFLNQEIDQFNAGEIRSPSISDYQILANDKDLNGIIEQNKDLIGSFKEIAGSLFVQDANAHTPKISSLINQMLLSGAIAATPSDDSLTSTDTSGGGGFSDKEMGTKLAAVGIGAAVGIIVPIALSVTVGLKALKEINGWVRAAIYAVEIAFMTFITVRDKQTADTLGERAEKYQDLYNQLVAIMAQSPGKDSSVPSPIPYQQVQPSISAAAMQELNGQCSTEGANGTANADPGCGCKASKSCKKVKIQDMKFPEFKTPSALASTAKMTENMANQVYGGNMTGAMTTANAIGRNAVAVKKMNENLMALANKKLAEYGKPAVDFNKISTDAKNNAMKQMRDGLAALSPSDRNAAIGAILGGPGAKKDQKELEEKVAAVSPGGRGGGGVTGTGKKGIFDFIGGKEDKEEEAKKGAVKEKEGKGLDAYEDSSKQITEGSEKNLFKIIEVRYMKTAYPIFFEKKKD